MEQDIKKEARKQYFKYFRVWFIIIAILLVVWGIMFVVDLQAGEPVRGNTQAPVERVYDFADVLTDQEEQSLREYIAECEQKAEIDIVLLTVNEDLPNDHAKMNAADDFYDLNLFGYDKVHGDGILFLDNWREDQEGSWISTCGRLVDELNYDDQDYIFDMVYMYIEDNPYEAYREYVEAVTMLTSGGGNIIPIWLVIIISVVAAGIFAVVNLNQSKAEDTTNAKTYVAGGKPVMGTMRDDFIRKNVVKRHIQTQSSSGGGGGSHRSSSGVRHGGSGRSR